MIVEVLEGKQVIFSSELKDGNYTIGRSQECHIVIPSPKMSKKHALIVIKKRKAAIVDLGSANGVFVNGILVKKQPIRNGDDVSLAGFKLRTRQGSLKKGEQKVTALPDAMSSEPPTFDGALALSQDASPMEVPDYQEGGYEDASGASAEAAPRSAQEKILRLIDTKVLLPLYELNKKVDWKVILFVILSIALLLTVILSFLSIVPWGREIATQEALDRGHAIIKQLVRENYRIMTTEGVEARLTTEIAETEPGFISVSIAEPQAGTILAPTRLFNKSVRNIKYLLAMKLIKENNEKTVSIKRKSGTWVLAQPIYVFSGESQGRSLEGIVLADFEISQRVEAVYEPMLRAALISVLLLLMAYFLIMKMVSHPIRELHMRLDAALKGDDHPIESETMIPELQNLATDINFSVNKLKELDTGGDELQQADEEEKEYEKFMVEMKNFDQMSSDALLVLDMDKKIIYIGHILEKLMDLDPKYSVGKNIVDACDDGTYTGTVVSLADNVVGSLGQFQENELDIHGVNRKIVATGFKSSAGNLMAIMVLVHIYDQE